jgi:hypothetical protein
VLACDLKLVPPTSDPETPAAAVRPRARAAVRAVPSAGVPSLERELAGVLEAAGLHARQSRAVATRLGWDGAGGSTLELAGAETGYTRERVRQLEALVRAHVAGTRPELPLTVRALELVAAVAPARRSEVAHALRTAELAAEPFDPAGLLAAAELLGLDAPLSLTRTLVVPAASAGQAAEAAAIARRLSRHPGAVSAAAVAGELGVDEATAARLLRLGHGLPQIAEGWFAVRGRPSRNERRLRKVLAVTGPLYVDELADALARGPRATPLPEDVLLGLCGSLDWLVVDRASRLVSPVGELDPAVELSPAEDVVLGVLLRHGPLPLNEAVTLAAAAGVTPATAQFVLRYAPVTQPVGDGRVAVRASSTAREPLAANA